MVSIDTLVDDYVRKNIELTWPSMNLIGIQESMGTWSPTCIAYKTVHAHLCIEVSLCFPSIQVLLSSPSSVWLKAREHEAKVYLLHENRDGPYQI